MKWFQWPVNIGQNLLHITVDAYLDLIYCSWENWLQTGLLSFWCDFAGGTCDLFLSQRQFIVHHCWLVWGTKTAFWQYCDVLGTRFGDCPRRCRVNWLPGGTECEIGASYGRIACQSDFVFCRHFVVLCTSCRCYEDNRSFGCARRLRPSQTITSSIAKFLAKFLLTTSKISVLHLALAWQITMQIWFVMWIMNEF